MRPVASPREELLASLEALLRNAREHATTLNGGDGGARSDGSSSKDSKEAYGRAIAWFRGHWAEVAHALDEATAAQEWASVAALSHAVVLYLARTEAWSELERVASGGAEAAHRTGDVRVQVACLQALAITLQGQARDDEAEPVFRTIETLLEAEGDDRARAALLAQWAQSRRRARRAAEAAEMLHTAALLYRRAGAALGEARTLGNLAVLLEEAGAPDQALARYQEAVDAFRRADSPGDELHALLAVGNAYGRRGAFPEAVAAFADAARLADELGNERAGAEARWLTAQALWHKGATDEAVTTARGALPLLERVRHPAAADATSMLRVAEVLDALAVLVTASDDDARRRVVAGSPLLADALAELLLDQYFADHDPVQVDHARAALHAAQEAAGRRQGEEDWNELVAVAGSPPLPAALRSLVVAFAASGGHDIEGLASAVEAVDATEHPRVAGRLLFTLGVRLYEDDSVAASEAAMQHLTGATALLSPELDPGTWGSSCDVLGQAYRNRRVGDPEDNRTRAIHWFRQALTVRRRGADAEVWAGSVNNLANAYLERTGDDRGENVDRAIVRLKAALSATTPARRPQEWALIKSNLAYAYTERLRGDEVDNIESAIAHGTEALEVPLPPERRATVLLNLGNAFMRRSYAERAENIERAIALYREGVNITGEAPDRRDAVVLRMVLGNAYCERLAGDPEQNLEEAISWYEQALQRLSRDDDRRSWAGAIDNLANAYGTRVVGLPRDNRRRAIELHEQALEVFGPGFYPREWARTLYNLAGTILRADDLSPADRRRAAALYEQALTVRTREQLPYEWAETATALAGVLAAVDDPERAVALYRGALDVFSPAVYPVDARRTAAALGELLAARGDWRAAADAFTTALDAAERLYQASVLQASKDLEIEATGDLARRAAYCLARSGDLRAAVTTIEEGRAKALREALAGTRFDRTAIGELDPALASAYADAGTRLQAAEAAERRARAVGPDHDNDLAAVRAELADARAQLAAVLHRIGSAAGEEAEAETSWASVERAVLAACPLAYLVVAEWGSVTLLVVRDDSGCTVEALWGDDTTEGAAFEALLTTEEGVLVGGLLTAPFGSELTRGAVSHAVPLVDRLVAPLAARLERLRAGTVALVPTGPVGLLPLPAGMPRCVTHMTPSAAALTAARHSLHRTTAARPRVVAVAGPGLDYAEAEAQAVAETFGNRAHLGAAASRDALLTEARAATHVHLACHGRYNPMAPLESSLDLADGSLQLGSLLDEGPAFSGVRLVVLSACESAVTDVARLADEAIGLPAGFLRAGAGGVVAALWPVADLPTYLLMTRFYERYTTRTGDSAREATSAAVALHDACAWLRDATGADIAAYVRARPTVLHAVQQVLPFIEGYPARRPFGEAHHWAAFTYVGG